MDFVDLSRTLSHALRHEPWLYELELDEEGWVSIHQLLESLRHEKIEWKDLSESDLEEMIRNSSKCRHEIENGRIRASYGHSLPGQLKRIPSSPPEFLFHGTAPESLPRIKSQGLLPMKRQYVHLSNDESTAWEVGRRKAKQPSLLRVSAKVAFENGILFYEGNQQVWLANSIPPQYIEFSIS